MDELFDSLPLQVSIERQIACITREISFRRHVYPRRVAAKAMTQEQADREILVMEAVRATLQRLADEETP